MIVCNNKGFNSQLIVEMAKQALINVQDSEFQDLKAKQSYRHFRERYGEVRISLPRQVGHTTAGLQLLFEFPDSLMFVTNNSAKRSCEALLNTYTDNINLRKRILDAVVYPTFDALVNIKPVDDRQFIIIDQASMFSNSSINFIESMLGTKTSIMLYLQ